MHILAVVKPVALRTSVSGACRVVATNQEEAIVDFDPDDTTQYLEGVDYPTSPRSISSCSRTCTSTTSTVWLSVDSTRLSR
jgi:hypothetical protein